MELFLILKFWLLNSRLYYNKRLSRNKSNKDPLIVLLHGYGSNENDLFSFKNFFDENYNIVSFRAPITIYEGMFAWYDIFYQNNIKSFDEIKAIESSKSIVDEIKQICREFNCDEKRITIIGFSQGAILGYSIALSNPGLIKNLVALSGYVEEKIIEFNTKKTNTSIYVSHGKNDDTIPYLESKKTLEILKEKGIQYDYNSFIQGHGVNQENLNSFLNWLKNKY